MTDRTVKDVMRDLIAEADKHNLFDSIRGDMPSWRDHPKRREHNAESVGQLVLSLPEEDRKILETMTSEEMEEFEWIFSGYTRPRPKEPNTRIRQPLKLHIDQDWLRRKTQEEDCDPPACPSCGAIAGACKDYPNCPMGE